MEFFKRLPKVELHAHLNGSIGPKTLKALAEECRKRNPDFDMTDVDEVVSSLTNGNDSDLMTLDQCFKMFKCIHSVSGSEKAVRLILDGVISSFADDGVVYLELRTTPRADLVSGMTKHSYLATVLEGIQSCKNTQIDVRLLISIDRRKGIEEAEENLKLAIEFQKDHGDKILGIDLSGDPNVGNIMDYVPVLTKAKEVGFKTAVHLAEISNETEVRDFLSIFSPDRIGHGTCLTEQRGGSAGIERMVVERAIPLELCPSSNVIGQTVRSFKDHHFKEWGIEKRGHPLAICTDDMGVFKTSLSREYFLIAKNFDLSQKEMTKIARDVIDIIFASDLVKESLRRKFDCFV